MRSIIIVLLLSVAAFAQGVAGDPGTGDFSLPASGSFTAASAQHYVASCATATTCAVTATNGIGAGDLVIITARVLAGVYITSTATSAGTPIEAGVRGGTATNRSMMVAAYIPSATAVASSGTVTVTFSAATGGARVDIRDYPYTGGTPALDAVADLSAASSVSSPFPGPSITLTGTNDVVFVGATAFNGSSSTNVTAVDGSWTHTDFSAAGFADQINVASVSAPNWTATTPTIKGTTLVAFGFNPTTCSGYGMQDFHGGTNGSGPLAADLTTGQAGLPGFASPSGGNANTSWVVNGNSTTELTYSTSAHHALGSAAPRFCWGGATYTDSGTLGFSWAPDGVTAGPNDIVFNTPWETVAPGAGTITIATSVVFFKTSMTSSDTVNNVIASIHTPGSGAFASAILHAAGGVIRIELEGSASTITITPGTWYQLMLKSDGSVGGTGASLELWSEDGSTQIGSTITVAYGTSPNNPDSFILGNADSAVASSGHSVLLDKWKMCYLPANGAACPWPFKE